MPLGPAITDLEQLKNHPAVTRLLDWNAGAVEGVKFDRDEMTIYLERESIREACSLLRDDLFVPSISFLTLLAWTGIRRSRALKSSTTCSRSRKKSAFA